MIVTFTRGKKGLCLPLTLPATPAEIESAFAELDSISKKNEATRINSIIGPGAFLEGYLKNKTVNLDFSLGHLNELAKKVDGMSENGIHKFEGALYAESVNGIEDIIQLADSLENYIFINGVTTEKDLGKFLVDTGYKGFPEKVRPYLDYAAIGAEYCAERGGAFTASGFTLRRRDMEALSPKKTEWWKPIFRAYLQTPAWQSKSSKPYAMDLPATSEQLRTAQNELAVPALEEAELLRAECLFNNLEPYIPLEEPDFAQLRDLSVILSAAMDDYGKSLVLAVYEMKRPQDLTQACELSQEIWRYELVDNVEDYGKNALYELCEDQEIVDTLDGFMDWDSFGRHMLEEDGLVFTEHGYIRLPDPDTPEMEQTMSFG